MRSLLVFPTLALLAASQSVTVSTDIPADANRTPDALSTDIPADANLTPDALPLDFLRAAVAPSYTIAAGVTSKDIPYVAATAIAAASVEQAATPLSIFPAVTDVPINAAGEDGSTPAPTAAPERRHVKDFLEKRKACDVQPSMPNFYTIKTYTSTDGYSSFIADKTISSVASAATAPPGYLESFKNLQGASSAYAYMGQLTVPTYDTDKCASECTKKSGCLAFNIYFELDPSKEPGTGCTNPDPIINIVCTFWGSALDKSTATNVGQWRADFHVVTAGSNGYTAGSNGDKAGSSGDTSNNDVTGPIDGWTGPTKLNNAILNAPLRDCANTWTYLGYKLFQNGPFDVNLCAAACNAQNEYNIAHPPTDGVNPMCAGFGTYLLTQNTKSGSKIIGQMCTMYTSAWDASYAVNTVSYDDSIGASYTYSLSFFYSMDSRQPICETEADIDYLRTSGAEFCTSYINYKGPATTVVSTTTPAVSTIYSTITETGTSTTFTSTTTQTVTKAAAKRAADLAPRAVATPASIAKWPASMISAACSKVATGTTTATSIETAVQALTTSFTTTTTYSTLSTAATTTATALPKPNMFTDPSFESGNKFGAFNPYGQIRGSGITADVTSADHHTGTNSLRVGKSARTGSQYYAFDEQFAIDIKKTFKWSFWAKNVDNDKAATATISLQGIIRGGEQYTGAVSVQVPVGSEWTYYEGPIADWTYFATLNYKLLGVGITFSQGATGDKKTPGAFFLDDLFISEV